MWIIFKVFIEFVTTLPVVLCSGFWPWLMWNFSSPSRDWTHTLCNGRGSLNHWTAREVPGSVSPFFPLNLLKMWEGTIYQRSFQRSSTFDAVGNYFLKDWNLGTFLVALFQWLRLCIPNAGNLGLIPGQGTEITHAATKNSHVATKDLTCCN